MPDLLPLPLSVEHRTGCFVLTADIAVVAPALLADPVVLLDEALWRAGRIRLVRRPEVAAGKSVIEFRVDSTLDDEEYSLEINTDGVRVAAGGVPGAHWAVQTLLQLLPPAVYRRSAITAASWSWPSLRIHDRPLYGWRGFMLDTARHFFPVHEVLRLIDLLSMHRLNVLHLHLTDDQGWRVQIHRYPRLTEVGAWRSGSMLGSGADAPVDNTPHGGYYTQDDVREIVAYAHARGIQVIPEIELPGHVQAALAAYPSLGVSEAPTEPWTRWGVNARCLNVEETTLEFMCAVLDEIMEIFPSELIGIGGDECRKDEWRADPRTQERMKQLGIRDEKELQSWFIGRINAHVRSRGRRVFGWDEILEGGLCEDAVVASWRGTSGALLAANAGHDVVMCPEDVVYFDYRQSSSPVEPIPTGVVTTVADVRAFTPIPEGLASNKHTHVLGGQANLWTEHVDSSRRLDYQVFPRLCALAEALWSGVDEPASNSFPERLRGHLSRLDAAGVEYRRSDGPRPWQRRPGISGKTYERAERAEQIADLTAHLDGRPA